MKVPEALARRVRLAGTALRRIGKALVTEPISLMAAALTYRTIFSLIPVLVLGLVLIRFFVDTDDAVSAALSKILDFAGLSEIETAPLTGGEGAAAAEGASVADWIQQIVIKVKGLNFQAITAVGVLTLIYAAVSLLVEVEQTFNELYGVRRGRSWTRRFLQYWFLISVGPLLLFASFWVGERFSSAATRLAQQAGEGTSQAASWLASWVVPTTISWLLLLSMYLTVPNTRVRLLPAAVGSLVGGVLWEAGKWAFGLYLQGAGYSTIYGSLALLPLFLLWVYVTWAIALAGLKIAHILQHLDVPDAHAAPVASAPVIADPAAALVTFAAIARSFGGGKPALPADLTDRTGLPLDTVRRFVERFVTRGLVHRVLHGPDEAYTLARPASQISAKEVLEEGFAAGPPSGHEPAVAIVDDLRAAQCRATEGLTVQDLLDGRRSPATAGEADAGAGRGVGVNGVRGEAGDGRWSGPGGGEGRTMAQRTQEPSP